MKNKVQKLFIRHPFLALSALIFFVLLLRNPFSNRTLIPNLEPFPDAFYYTTPPRCFLSGQGWKMCRLYDSTIEGVKPAVPPAYSLTMLPAYLLNDDVRTFYFANIILSFISLILLYKVARNFLKNQYLVGLLLFLYITNYFIYWYPTLAMAENLLLPLFLLSILLLQNKASFKKSFLVGLVSAGFYATKYAFAPLTVFLPIVYFAKVLLSDKSNKSRLKHFLFMAIPAGLILSKLLGIELIKSVFNQVSNGAIDSNSTSAVTSGGGYFSINYFSKHIVEYSYALIGKSQRFLWDGTPLTSKWVAYPALGGLLIAFKQKRFRFAKLWLVVATIFQLLFISTFYVVDIRYVFHFLPILLLGLGFFLQFIHKNYLKRKKLFLLFLGVIFLIYSATNAMRLKSVIMVNLKYAETPWWYLSQLQMNEFFDGLPKAEEKPVLITLSSPFLTDNYSNQNYITLPLNDQQDFHGSMLEIWGSNNYDDLIALYSEKLEQGRQIYITNYGVSAAGHFKQSYANIEESFNLEQVHTGCFDLCDIYWLSSLETEE